MADRKGSTGKSGMNVDTALVRELAEMLGDTGLTEIEVEDGERKIRVARGGDHQLLVHDSLQHHLRANKRIEH